MERWEWAYCGLWLPATLASFAGAWIALDGWLNVLASTCIAGSGIAFVMAARLLMEDQS